jgi:FlaA1/EpsC-like NDP-sugar epimerase
MDKEQIKKALNGKHILVTGGTGSFGKYRFFRHFNGSADAVE